MGRKQDVDMGLPKASVAERKNVEGNELLERPVRTRWCQECSQESIHIEERKKNAGLGRGRNCAVMQTQSRLFQALNSSNSSQFRVRRPHFFLISALPRH